ncbi:transposase [Staphylococcus virus vB_SurM-PSU6]|nr:transposase [Staphylococcus virus vB_SurM-PSU6]
MSESTTYRKIKLRLIPTKEQEELMWKHVHASRFIYNWGLERWYSNLDTGIKNTTSNKLSKELKTVKEENPWLKGVSNKTLVKSLQVLEFNMKRFFKKQTKRPKFKSSKSSIPSFKTRTETKWGNKHLPNIEGDRIRLEKLKLVKLSSKITKSMKEKDINPVFYSSTIYYDGKYWYISLAYKVENQDKKELTNETIGIDLGIKSLSTCSNGKSYKNINKSSKVKKLEKRLTRLQRQLSRKYEMNKDKIRVGLLSTDGTPKIDKQGRHMYKYSKTKNIVKLEKEIKLLHRKLKNIRNNHVHTMTKEIVELLPQEIVIEDLKVSNMLKNKHLSKSITKANWYEIRRQLTYKCEDRGILLTIANQYYPSSQICSHCGKRLTKQDKLSLSQRTFICSCGNNIDRDYNASLNLKNYRYSNWYQNNIISQ